jgi:hypothetical protein
MVLPVSTVVTNHYTCVRTHQPTPTCTHAQQIHTYARTHTHTDDTKNVITLNIKQFQFAHLGLNLTNDKNICMCHSPWNKN